MQRALVSLRTPLGTQDICMGLTVMTQDLQDICIILEQAEA